MPDVDHAAPVRTPHPALAPLVASLTGYHHVLGEDVLHHGLPSSSATVVLSFDEPLDVSWYDAPGSRVQHWTLASGMHLAPAVVHTHGHQHGIQLALTPLGARVLLGVPLGALAEELVPHEDLPLGLGADVHAQIAGTTSWERRFDVLEEHLLRLVHDRVARPQPEVAEAWRLVQASGGRLPTAEIARRIGWSTRRLHARFTAEHGVSPKQLSRIARFENARRLAESGLRLVEVAARAGYADQAHLGREWRSLAGLTPGEMLANPFRFVQDSPDSPAAGCGS